MYILGLSYDIDAAACLVKDGVPLAASAEERFSKIKHDRGFPNQAIKFCLGREGIKMEDLEWAAMGWNPSIHLKPLLWRQSSRVRHHAEYLYAVPNMLFQHFSERPRDRVTEQVHHFEDGRTLRTAYVEHHLCHAAWSFVSPFEDCAILTIDGFGEDTSTMLSQCVGNKIEVLQQTKRPHSLGSLYAAITQYLGFKPNQDEGTVMSLAAMAEPKFVDDFREMCRLNEDDGTFELDLTYFSYFQEDTDRVSPKFVEKYGPVRKWEDEITDHHMSVAASLQVVFEETYMGMLRNLHKRTGHKQVVVAGGVALNCVANGRILEQTPFEDIFIPPASGDDGTSTGAALYLYHHHLDNPRTGKVFKRASLGWDVTDDEAKELIDVSVRRHHKIDAADTPRVAARLLAKDRIVGWCQGQAEFGPRALGNRSIMANPGNLDLKDQLNATIKFRLWFRPFAPSMLADHVGELFQNGVVSPFMLLAFTVKPEWRERVIGILHTDDTARVQTVTPDENERYHAVIEHFHKLTGKPIILNTSLNVRGEPIANTAKDAMACFDSTAMDYLFLGNYVLCKPQADCIADLEEAIKGDPQ